MRVGVSTIPYHRGIEAQILRRDITGEQGSAASLVNGAYSKFADKCNLVGIEVYAGVSNTFDVDVLKKNNVRLHCFNEHREKRNGLNFNPATKNVDELEYTLSLIEKAIALANKIGSDTMVLHPGFSYVKKGIVNIRDHASRIGEIHDMAKEEGVELLVENLPTDVPQIKYSNENFLPGMERYIMTTPEDMEEVSKVSRICVDFGHANTVAAHNPGISLEDFTRDSILSKAGKVHLVDNFGEERHMTIGEGGIDWEMVCSSIAKYENIEDAVIETLTPWGGRMSVRRINNILNKTSFDRLNY